MIKKSIAFVAAAVVSLFAVDMSFHGEIETDAGVNFYNKKWKASYSALNDITLIGDIKLNDGVSVALTYRNLFQKGTTPIYDAIVSDGYQNKRGITVDSMGYIIDHTEDRMVDVNGLPLQVLLSWEFTKGGTVLVGDYTTSAGTTNLRRYDNDMAFASLYREHTLRGVGVKASDGTFFVGMVDSLQGSLGVNAQYDVSLINKPRTKMSVTPVIDWVLFGSGTETRVITEATGPGETSVLIEGGRSRNWNIGVEGVYSSYFESIEYSVSGALGVSPYRGHNTITVLAEPSVNVGVFTLSTGGFYAALAKEAEAAYLQTDMPVQWFLYAEPSMEITSKISAGLLYEYHDTSFKYGDDMTNVIQPTLYLYPNDVMDFWLTAGYAFDQDFDEKLFSFDIQTSVRF
ncbi:MAG: hypothetical protein OCC49_15175 [Fibrobacterales bacterium]